MVPLFHTILIPQRSYIQHFIIAGIGFLPLPSLLLSLPPPIRRVYSASCDINSIWVMRALLKA